MKKISYLFLLMFISGSIFSQEITLMSYNIRYDTKDDGINTWFNRKYDVLALIKHYNPEVVGVQEALKNQLDYLAENSEYSFVGKGRDDGKEAGEYAAILYDTTRVSLIDSGMFWLSETPNRPSKGWDACCKRVVTWAKFKEQGKEFYFFNTHFDHEGQDAIKESSKLLLEKVKVIAGDSSLFISGDFNFEPDNCSYQYLVDPELKVSVKDSYTHSDKNSFDRPTTFRGFDVKSSEWDIMIDYIFFKNGVRILEYSIDSSSNGEAYFSDHLPIVVRAKFIDK